MTHVLPVVESIKRAIREALAILPDPIAADILACLLKERSSVASVEVLTSEDVKKMHFDSMPEKPIL